MELLKELINANGPSGNEEDVRTVIHREIKKYVDNIHVDEMGNLIAHKKGKRPSVMLAAHMDEVGLMIKRITEDGKIFCTDIGGITIDGLIGQRISLKSEKGYIRGIITSKDTSIGENLQELPTIDSFIVDTGLTKKELEAIGLQIGTYVYVEGEATFLGSDQIISGKALDDRIGCYILIELAKKLKKNNSDIYYVFTVQEEIGLYGAKTSAFNIDPHWAIVVETTSANDFLENPTRCIGKGPCITMKDGEFIANRCINDALIKIAKDNKIPYQIEASAEGTTDATNISVTRGGVPSTVISIPVRNIHTTVSIANVSDIKNMIVILEKILRNPPRICI
ncbi:MAG: M42 family peptidase [Candidatus Aenigmatarchaeota archaeon]